MLGGGGGGHHGGGHHGGGGGRGGWAGGRPGGYWGGGWGYPLYVDGPTYVVEESAPIVYVDDPNDPGHKKQVPYAGVGALGLGGVVGGALAGAAILTVVAIVFAPAILGGYLGYKYVPKHPVLGAIGGAVALPTALSVLLAPFTKKDV